MKEQYFIKYDCDFDLYDSEEERDKELQRILENDWRDIIESECELIVGVITKEYVSKQYDESEFTQEELDDQYNGEIPYYLEEINYARNN
jgi:hypothetical protein